MNGLEELENLVGYAGWEPTTSGQIEIQELYTTIKHELNKLEKIKAEFEPSDFSSEEKLMRILAILEG